VAGDAVRDTTMSWYWWVIGPGALVVFVLGIVVVAYAKPSGGQRDIEDPERLR
jgi:bacteriorhodopsin